MRLACGDHSFPLLEHEHACDLIRALGFDAFDLGLMGNRSHIRPEVVREDVAAWAGRIGERLAARDLEVVDVLMIPWTDHEVMAPNHPDADERARGRELFGEMLAFVDRLGAPGMTILPGVVFDGDEQSAALERAAGELGERVVEAREAGLRLSVEPHVGSVVESPQDAERLLEMTPGLEVTLDHSHFFRQGYELTDVSRLVPRTRHYHARCARAGRLQTRMADNGIDFEAAVDELRGVAYDGFLSVEYTWTDWERCNESDNLSETILLRDRLSAAVIGEPWAPFVARH